ncbi:MAG TPA: NADPH-dependent FMN reductase [Pyrinomonadaceae bacterium]|nr:NADPH-dependent FMN reductase [Pyrinomonadaceae bacterium]
MTAPVQILLISGSAREPSYTRTLTKVVQQVLIERGAETVHWDLRQSPLPIADPSFHEDPSRHTSAKVRRLVAHATASDAFILASPIYHNSYSGALKNALDHLAIPQFHHKPVGLISHGGDHSPQAVDHLRIVVRGLLGTAIPTQVCTAVQDYSDRAQGYELVSPAIINRIDRLVTELLVFARMFRLVRQAVT